MTSRRAQFPIVGIGASAGGIEALEGFFQGLPAEPGLAFIVVTHLSPERESQLHLIISRYTDLDVEVAQEGMLVQPNCVYVLPADAILSMRGGKLHLRKPSSRRERKPVDVLFSSLAIELEDYAASVVLSGGDGDGTLGTKAVKERGGMTFAQIADGHGPQHPSMPDSAIATGYVDFALPVEAMGAQLVAFARSLDGDAKGEAELADAKSAQAEISEIIRNQIGHDFGGYKSKTFFRRVQRRMQVMLAADQKAYIEILKSDPKEVGALFHDLLINVTNFFRDPDAFAKLAELVIPKLFEGRGADDAVRVWVPGCATGEEVYSIAILLREHLDTLVAQPRVQVFATDIDEAALSVARAGRYPEALLEGVSADRRDRFFAQDGGSFILAKEIRDLCIFSPHSVIRDPPFSRLDLISCRNLLIYFGPEIQNQVLPIFHYALRERGFLFLGQSESVGKFGEFFEAIDKKHRVFRARDDAGPPAQSLTTVRRKPELPATGGARKKTIVQTQGVALRQALEYQVLERFAPAHVLLNRDGDVLQFSARTNRYLELAPGAPTRQLMALARKGLRLELRAALREVMETDTPAARSAISLTADDGRVQMVRIDIEPLAERGDGPPLYVVVFTDEGPLLSAQDAYDRTPPAENGASAMIERELRDTKERLQSLIEEYEAALEELRTSNEELLSVNEELQSSNEELEASKEEQQSLNEELNTVNTELTQKVDALDRANDDLQNLFDSTQIPTVFLNRNLAIRSYTPGLRELFNVLPSDRGRPLTDLNSQLSLPTLVEDIKAVFSGAPIIDRDVSHPTTGKHYVLRIATFRTMDDVIEGVVMTFVDVTRLTQAQAHQHVLLSELNNRVQSMLMIVMGIAQESRDMPEATQLFLEAFSGRLRSMARSYDLLSAHNWTQSSLHDLVRAELAPLGLDGVELSGPDIHLKPKAALSMGMIIHELTTNACKHGSLSKPGGSLDITWSSKSSKAGVEVALIWTETADHGELDLSNRGFGLKLIDREVVHNLAGRFSLETRPSGLEARVEFPLIQTL